MTAQEAIDILKTGFDCNLPMLEPVYKLAIEALEKQIPKFVECKEWKGMRDTRYKCPLCSKNVRNDETYCHKCGQAIKFPKLKKVDNHLELDWSEV